MSPDLPIPETETGLNARWLSGVLNQTIETVTIQRIGQAEGFTGGGLFRLTFDGQSLVAKLSPTDPALRATFAAANHREVAFYAMASSRRVPVPKCHLGAFDPATGASLLLIEDFRTARSVGFLQGCSAQDAGLVIDALAAIHGAFWQAPELDGIDSEALLAEVDFAQAWAAYPSRVAALLPDLALPPDFVALGDFLATHGTDVFRALWTRGPRTCLHRDAQVDNVLFAPDGAVWLDWQFTGAGRGVCDLSFFLASSLDPETRRSCEDALIARYYRALLAAGVTGFTASQCRADYAVSVVGRLLITVMATVKLDNSDAHRRAWRRADLTRLLAFVADHGLTAQRLAEWLKNDAPAGEETGAS